MARNVFNFIWVPPSRVKETRLPAAQTADNKVNIQTRMTRGVILFPALMTPLVYVAGKDKPWLELIVACEHELTPAMVNRQLKVSLNLDASKTYDPDPLFGGASGNIEVEEAGSVDPKARARITTHDARFTGILHPSISAALKNKKLERLYRVKVGASCLPRASGSEEHKCSSAEKQFVAYRHLRRGDLGSSGPDPDIARVARTAVVGRELQDQMIRDMLQNRLGKASPIAGRGRYAFRMDRDSVNLFDVDEKDPIVAYHPVFELSGDEAFGFANFGHASDLHLNCRWQILGRTPARVIEYPNDSAYEKESPPIGSLVMETNRSAHNVLSRLCETAADIILVGGDIIDHIRNAYWPGLLRPREPSVTDVWNAVDLRDGAYTDNSYPAGLDLIAFYTFVLDFCRKSNKPFFAVVGNHDCYVDAYGISPRINSTRANEGIPADLNLTFYEALLAFGESAGHLRRVGSSFSPEWFDWFHHVFSPFADFSFQLPHQNLVGLGWGDVEDILDPPGMSQGFGHLPRSDEAIAKHQLELLQEAVDGRKARPVVLFTHFTFLSYEEEIPSSPNGNPGSPGHLDEGDSHFEMGSFDEGRNKIRGMLKQRQIQCIITGHSHRRGLYLLGTGKGDEIPSFMYDTGPNSGIGSGDGIKMTDLPASAPPIAPAIVVSDSAGPYPRYNRGGEFEKWGGDRPGGTLVLTDKATGAISHVKAIQAIGRSRARAAVAMDYYDVIERNVFEDNRIQTLPFPRKYLNPAGRKGVDVCFQVRTQLSEEISKVLKIRIHRLIFAGRVEEGGDWLHIEAAQDQKPGLWNIPGASSQDFCDWARFSKPSERFVSLKLSCADPFLNKHYDWDSHWNFEVQVVVESVGFLYPNREFRMARPTRKIEGRVRNASWPEIPNFAFRKNVNPKYWGPLKK